MRFMIFFTVVKQGGNITKANYYKLFEKGHPTKSATVAIKKLFKRAYS
jgi:hypothetical protein